jgi:hypothetical protein
MNGKGSSTVRHKPPRTLVGVGLAALVATGGIAYSSRSRARDSEARLQRLEHELARANAQLGVLEARPATVVVRPPPESPGAAALTPDVGTAPHPEARAAEAALAARDARRDPDGPRRSVEKLATAMDQRLAAETPDATWSTTTEQALRTVIAERAAGSKLLDVQCRTTLCRLLIRHGSLADRKDFAASVAREDPFRTATLYRAGSGSPEAALETNVYVVREGYDLRGQPQAMVSAFQDMGHQAAAGKPTAAGFAYSGTP